MRFISCPGKVDISRQGQIFTRAKETAAAALRIWRCELLWWQFSSELRGARFCPRWEGSGWEMFGDHQLIRQGAFCWQPSSYSYFWWDSNTNPLVVFFSFSFWSKIPSPLVLHLNLREHFLWLPFCLDIWQVFSHSVAFPKESSTHSYPR